MWVIFSLATQFGDFIDYWTIYGDKSGHSKGKTWQHRPSVIWQHRKNIQNKKSWHQNVIYHFKVSFRSLKYGSIDFVFSTQIELSKGPALPPSSSGKMSLFTILWSDSKFEWKLIKSLISWAKNGLITLKTIINMYGALTRWISRNQSGKLDWMKLDMIFASPME